MHLRDPVFLRSGWFVAYIFWFLVTYVIIMSILVCVVCYFVPSLSPLLVFPEIQQ